MAVLTMTRQLKNMWRRLGSIHLTVVLCLLLVGDLTWGYICINGNIQVFSPLNDIGLIAWLTTYGRNTLSHTAWFYLLMILLVLLGGNTFVCTTDRVIGLIKRRKHYPFSRFIFKFAPHIMHYALIVILTGYLCSYLFAQVLDQQTMVVNKPVSLPGTNAAITLTSFEPDYYESDRLPSFKDRVLLPKALLLITDDKTRHTTLLTLNRPLYVKNYAIFIKDFAPKNKDGGMNPTVRIDVTIRKDPGVKLYLMGIILFTAGMALYLSEWIFVKQVRKDVI